jgi:hypothetical protein
MEHGKDFVGEVYFEGIIQWVDVFKHEFQKCFETTKWLMHLTYLSSY